MISIRKLVKQFATGEQTVAALQGVDLEVSKGEFFVLLGPSGSGKTTLLRSVAGLEKPDSGEISLNGKTVFSGSRKIAALPEEREIGMVFQSYAIWPHLTVAENIGLVLTHGRSRLSKSAAQERIRHALSLVQLDDYGSRPSRLLSGGQQQRVALARALAVNPALLLMDEPLSNLDARLREEVRTSIKKVAMQLGITVLYVTHDQVEAMVLADRIAVMSHGQILQIGNPFELYRAPANALVAEFFGSINWLRGKIAGNGTVESEVGTLVIENQRQYEGDVVVGVRPEDVRLAANSDSGENILTGGIVGSVFLGDQITAEVKIKDKVLIAKASPEREYPVGNISVRLPKERLVIFPDTTAK
ncbi:MAG: ABC transporter ATP-binding protein [Deltaproteobacteria bacterium]|nr:ABC transporter ATP-binding protein [Deltaproteobacteria bacterium]